MILKEGTTLQLSICLQSLFFQKRTHAIAGAIPLAPVHKNTLLVLPTNHPLKRTYFMDGPFMMYLKYINFQDFLQIGSSQSVESCLIK